MNSRDSIDVDIYQYLKEQREERNRLFFNIVLISIAIGITVLIGFIYVKLRSIYYNDPSEINDLVNYSALALSVAVFITFLAGEDIEKELVIGFPVTIISYFLFRWCFLSINPVHSIYAGMMRTVISYCEKIPALHVTYKVLSPFLLPIILSIPLMFFGSVLRVSTGFLKDERLSRQCTFLHNSVWVIFAVCLGYVVLLGTEEYETSLIEQIWHYVSIFFSIAFIVVIKETIYD